MTTITITLEGTPEAPDLGTDMIAEQIVKAARVINETVGNACGITATMITSTITN